MGEIKQCAAMEQVSIHGNHNSRALVYKNAQSDKRHACEQLPDTYRLDGVLLPFALVEVGFN